MVLIHTQTNTFVLVQQRLELECRSGHESAFNHVFHKGSCTTETPSAEEQ